MVSFEHNTAFRATGNMKLCKLNLHVSGRSPSFVKNVYRYPSQQLKASGIVEEWYRRNLRYCAIGGKKVQLKTIRAARCFCSDLYGPGAVGYRFPLSRKKEGS